MAGAESLVTTIPRARRTAPSSTPSVDADGHAPRNCDYHPSQRASIGVMPESPAGIVHIARVCRPAHCKVHDRAGPPGGGSGEPADEGGSGRGRPADRRFSEPAGRS
jgi:hypothetical protein